MINTCIHIHRHVSYDAQYEYPNYINVTILKINFKSNERIHRQRKHTENVKREKETQNSTFYKGKLKTEQMQNRKKKILALYAVYLLFFYYTYANEKLK